MPSAAGQEGLESEDKALPGSSGENLQHAPCLASFPRMQQLKLWNGDSQKCKCQGETDTDILSSTQGKNSQAQPWSQPSPRRQALGRSPSFPTRNPNSLRSRCLCPGSGTARSVICTWKGQDQCRALETYLPLGVSFIFHQLQAMLVLQVSVELPFGTVDEAAHRALQTT